MQNMSKQGRLSVVVEEEQIEFLSKLHFPWIKIAQLLDISESTLRSKRAAYGIGLPLMIQTGYQCQMCKLPMGKNCSAFRHK